MESNSLVLKLQCALESPWGFIKRLQDHILKVSDSVDLGWGPIVCISNISQVMLMLLVWDHILNYITLEYLPFYSFFFFKTLFYLF